ncbi:hypothetical protein [Halorussus salinisoli]|uniref:hypothetical protein n=1 Tax=Halorussus salinisoli TaxID=2558242 RepID=UPI0010C1DE4A|nr:hypothetical protein [Halorussus salinisoli]
MFSVAAGSYATTSASRLLCGLDQFEVVRHLVEVLVLKQFVILAAQIAEHPDPPNQHALVVVVRNVVVVDRVGHGLDLGGQRREVLFALGLRWRVLTHDRSPPERYGRPSDYAAVQGHPWESRAGESYTIGATD